MFKRIGSLFVMAVLAYPYSGFGQVAVSGQERFVQPIIINGQQVQGVLVVENGIVQTHTCSSPQQYVTVDQSSSGWACFDPTTGAWLLRSLPPAQTTTYVYQQPPTYVPSTIIPTYSYAYPAYSYAYPAYSYAYPAYGYYPYAYYPYFAGPRFSVGFGFGYPVIRRPIVINRVGPGVIARGGSIGVRRGGSFAPSRPFGGGFGGGRSGRVVGRVGRR